MSDAQTKSPDDWMLHKAALRWDYVGFRHWVLVNGDGRIVAEVTGSHPAGTFLYNGEKYISEDHAKAAAMAAVS